MAIKIWGGGSTGGSNGEWDTATNWDGDSLPVNGDSLLFDGTCLGVLLVGPSVAINIENIQIDLAGTGFLFMTSGNEPLYIFGSLINNGTSEAKIRFFPAGINQIIGKWNGFVTGFLAPLNYGYLAMLDVSFDADNYLMFDGYGPNVQHLQYGIVDSSLNVTSASSFNSFSVENLNSFASSGGWTITGVERIYSTTINLTNVFLNGMPTTFTLQCSTINIDYYENIRGNMGTGSTIPRIVFPIATVMNITSATDYITFNSSNLDTIFIFEAASTMNLHNKANIYGTASSMGSFGGLIAMEALVQTSVSLTINCYDDSRLFGAILQGQFIPASFAASGLYGTLTILMRDNSIYCGMISAGFGTGGVSFLDNSNISFEYTYTPYTGFGSQYFIFNYPTTVAIPKTFVFKSSF